MNSDIKEFDLKNCIQRTADRLGITYKAAEPIAKAFLAELENGLAEHGRIEFLGHFSIALKVRAPRSGSIRTRSGETKAWSVSERVEPEFQAFGKLRQLIEEKQGKPCI